MTSQLSWQSTALLMLGSRVQVPSGSQIKYTEWASILVLIGYQLSRKQVVVTLKILQTTNDKVSENQLAYALFGVRIGQTQAQEVQKSLKSKALTIMSHGKILQRKPSLIQTTQQMRSLLIKKLQTLRLIDILHYWLQRVQITTMKFGQDSCNSMVLTIPKKSLSKGLQRSGYMTMGLSWKHFCRQLLFITIATEVSISKILL